MCFLQPCVDVCVHVRCSFIFCDDGVASGFEGRFWILTPGALAIKKKIGATFAVPGLLKCVKQWPVGLWVLGHDFAYLWGPGTAQ